MIILSSCQQNMPDKNKLVQQYYDIKKNDFLKKKDEACKKEIKDIAENQLDSIIDQYVKSKLLDSITFPNRPNKPFKPEHIIDKVQKFKIDTTKNNLK